MCGEGATPFRFLTVVTRPWPVVTRPWKTVSRRVRQRIFWHDDILDVDLITSETKNRLNSAGNDWVIALQFHARILKWKVQAIRIRGQKLIWTEQQEDEGV